jgi:hypothetical protein
MPISLQQSLGAGYAMLDEPPQVEADSDDNTAEMAPQATATVEKGPPSSKKEAKIATESPGTKHDRIIRDKRSAKPAKSEKDDSKKDGETKKLSIAAAVTAYCLRMGPWIVVSACGNVLSQTASISACYEAAKCGSALLIICAGCLRFPPMQAFDTPDNLLKDKEGYFYKQLTEENSGINS